jgi:outer membrane protein OmpA-like peptidoglycan-associated protein/Tol biopolymer transport system component
MAAKSKNFIGKLALMLTVFATSIQTYSQNNQEKVDELINQRNFEEAIQVCKALLADAPEDPSLNFKLGYCYINTPLKKTEAIPYIKKSTEIYKQNNDNSATALEASFYLGQAYHKTYEFKEAIKVLQELRERVNNNEMVEAIDEEIVECKTGINLVSSPVNLQVTNIGNSINTGFSDHSPVVSADESVIIFTSRRKNSENETLKPDGQPNEDIYISNFDGKEWSEPTSISENINTSEHEASIGISADGQELLIYTETDGGSILSSRLIGDEWSTPQNLGENINSRWRETHASISADGHYLYFTSDRPGGYGGLDIYVSEKNDNGTWGKAENLGPTVNTPQDEEGPFIHYDGVTLYFSSKGHATMGGFDILWTKKNEFGTWSIPVNMGYPVNTTENDAFFVMTADGKRAYYASYREDGKGSTDIFMMGLPEAEEKPLTVVKGVIQVCKKDAANVNIMVSDKYTKEIVGIYKPNSKTGKYLFILTRGRKYQASYRIDKTEVHSEDFHIDDNADFQVLYKPIQIHNGSPCNEIVGVETKEDSVMVASMYKKVVEEESGKTYVENIMFRINNSEITYFKNNLDKLINYLKQHPTTKIEIIGYADTQGPEAYNLKLSEHRARSVNQYLIKKGVRKEQLTYKGDGEKNQITINNYKDGSYVWQSLPYNRRVEFNIINDEANNLVVKEFNIPEPYLIEKGDIENTDISDYERKYTIQLGAFSKPISVGHFKKLKNIRVYFTGQYYLYAFGEFDSKELANEELETIKHLGYKDAFTRKLSYYFPKRLKEVNLVGEK